MDRGRGSADQRNQATISHELQKYSRSRTGKGMNSREVAGRLDPCRGDRDVAGGQRAGAEARHRRAGAKARRRQPLAAGDPDPPSGQPRSAPWPPSRKERGRRRRRAPSRPDGMPQARGRQIQPRGRRIRAPPGREPAGSRRPMHTELRSTSGLQERERGGEEEERAGRGITARVRWRRREVRECRRRGLRGWLWGQRKGVRECLLGWAVSNRQIRIGRRTQYSRN